MIELIFISSVCVLGMCYIYCVGRNIAFLWDMAPDGYLGLEVKMLRIDALAKIISIGCITICFWIILMIGLLVNFDFITIPFERTPRDFTEKFMFVLIGIGAVCLFGYEYGQKQFNQLPKRATELIPDDKVKSILWFHWIYNLGFIAFGMNISLHFAFRTFL